MPLERIALAAQRRETEELHDHFKRSARHRVAWLALVVLVAVALVVAALPASAQTPSGEGGASLPLLIECQSARCAGSNVTSSNR